MSNHSNQFDESNAKNGNDNTNGNANISISSSNSSRHNISANLSTTMDTSHRNERSSSVSEFKRNNHRRRSSSSHRARKTSSSPARTQLASYINRKRSRSVSQSKSKNLRSNYDSKPQQNNQSNTNDNRNDLRRRIKRSRTKSRSRSRSLDNSRYPSSRDNKYDKTQNGQHLNKTTSSSFNGHPSSNPIDLGERINPSPNNVLAVFGLDRNATERDLYGMFEKYGCRECKIIFDKFTKAPKGFGFIYFNKVEEAVRAKEKTNGKFILDRPIRVDYSIGERDFYNKNDLAMMLQSPPHHSSSSYAHNTTSSYKQHYNNGISGDRLAPLPPHSAALPISSYRDSRHNAHQPSHRYRPEYPLHFDQFRQRSSLTVGGRHGVASKYGRRFTPSPPSTPPVPPHYDYHRQAHYQPFASNYHQAYTNPHHHHHHPPHHHQDRNKTDRRGVDDRFSPRQVKRYVDSRRISTHLDVIQDQNDLAYQLRHPEPGYTKRSRSGERYTSASSNRRYGNDTNHHKEYSNGLSTTHTTQMSTQKSYGSNSKYTNEYHSRR